MSRKAVIGVVLAAGAAVWLACAPSRCRTLEAAFWFEDVTFASERLGGPLTKQDVETIASLARAEVARAFTGLNIAFTDRRDATHRVRVVQELRDMRLLRDTWIPAESRAMAGLGGQGSVSFSWLAGSALVYAPEDASRAVLLEAIARGIGRSAVHEFVHIILPRAPIHDSRDIGSYEYRSAARREQYFGEMRWDLAWPLLQARLAPCESRS